MIDRGDERAVSTVVGAVLILGILVTALALYQVNVVPTENSQVEWDHHQSVHGDLLDLRNAIDQSGDPANVRQTTNVRLELGTQYPTRTWTTNPPNPRGEIRTVDVDDQVVVNFNDSGEDRFNTSFLEYEPRYNEYDGPLSVLEHGLLYERHADGGDATRDRGTVIQGDDVVIPLVMSDLSESSTGSVSVSVTRLVDYQESEEVVDHVRWPTDEVDEWNESYDAVEEYDDEEGYVKLDDPDSVFIAEIGVGDDPESQNEDKFGDNWEPSSPPEDDDGEDDDDEGEDEEMTMAESVEFSEAEATGEDGSTVEFTLENTEDEEVIMTSLAMEYPDEDGEASRVFGEDEESELEFDGNDGNGFFNAGNQNSNINLDGTIYVFEEDGEEGENELIGSQSTSVGTLEEFNSGDSGRSGGPVNMSGEELTFTIGFDDDSEKIIIKKIT